MFALKKSPAAAAYIRQALDTYKFLKNQPDLSPRNPTINRVLSAFVLATMRKRAPEEIQEIMSSALINEVAPHLRRLLGQAEYEMEAYSAMAMMGLIAKSEPQYSSYRDFIYRDNYAALIESELKAMKWNTKRPPIKKGRESVAFVGAGPLPISAIMFALRTGEDVTCIDSDPRACHLGSALIRHLAQHEPQCHGIDKHVHYVHAAGEDHDYVTHPVVFIASLVERKDPVVMRIVKTSHTIATTVLRSAEGLSALLYKPEECLAGQEFYNLYFSGKSEPDSQAINTSLVYRFPSGKYHARTKPGLVSASDDLNVLSPRRRRMRFIPTSEPI